MRRIDEKLVNLVRTGLLCLVFWLVVLALVGCASTPLEKAQVVGITAVHTVEAAMFALAVEYEEGRLPKATMMRAVQLYRRWEMAYAAYKGLVELWEQTGRKPDNLDDFQAQVAALAAELHAIVELFKEQSGGARENRRITPCD